MRVDYIIAEIGSTTTLCTAFDFSQVEPKILAQGKSYTTVIEGDVTVGLKNAIIDIEEQIGESLTWGKMLATSSAAGGLRMTVHGLVHDMTVKASKEAALGAGAIIKMVTSGKMRASDIKEIKRINPNLIMIAGGTDYGERDTALYNAQLIAKENLNIPLIYCGNKANVPEIIEIFEGQEIYIVPNVYPRIDELNVEPARKIIQEAFEKNIVKAEGMDKIRNMVDGSIMPTPGAVMESTEMLYELIGDVVVVDVGGATTDIHSVTEGSCEIMNILVNPEPKAKRTVEGDLGVYINSNSIIELLNIKDLQKLDLETIKSNIKAIPENDIEKECSSILCKKACEVALARHCGYIKRIFVGENNYVAYGKDLSKVRYIVGTGGALTRLPKGRETLKNLRYEGRELTMMPRSESNILLDTKYIMACAGVLSKENKEYALRLLEYSIK
ncbi:MAG: GlmL-related ornithine degradation protein [Clostridium sp.]